MQKETIINKIKIGKNFGIFKFYRVQQTKILKNKSKIIIKMT